MPIDPDYMLAAACVDPCLSKLKNSDSDYCYPLIQQFGDEEALMGDLEYHPSVFMHANQIDALAVISKYAYHKAGGCYD